jgi:hypothetical protein
VENLIRDLLGGHSAETGHLHCKKLLRDSWIYFDQNFLGQELGRLFPARESLVSVIPAGDGNPRNHFLQCGHFRKKNSRGEMFIFRNPK